MIINQKTLGELCARVAAGDEQARRDFDRHVPPLVEIVVSRWLRREPHDASAGHSVKALDAAVGNILPVAHSIGCARQITRTICARMIAEFATGGRPRSRAIAETICARGQWDTVGQPTG